MDAQWIRDQVNQVEGFAAGAKQMLMIISQQLAKEEKEKQEKENKEGN